MTSTTYTFASDSVYITNKTNLTSNSSSVTADTAEGEYCVRIHLENLVWKVKRQMIDISVPEMDENVLPLVYIIDLGQAKQMIQIKGKLFDTTSDSEDSVLTKEENLVRLAYQTSPGEGLTLVVPDRTNTTRHVFSENESDSLYPAFHINNLEISRESKSQTNLQSGTRYSMRTVNLEGTVGDKQS